MNKTLPEIIAESDLSIYPDLAFAPWGTDIERHLVLLEAKRRAESEAFYRGWTAATHKMRMLLNSLPAPSR